MKKVLFVTYGSGHVKMVLPVATALGDSGMARPTVLALTTAASVILQSGLEMVQFKDFVTPGDANALEWGRTLMGEMGEPVLDEAETVAYLGLCFSDLVATLGETGAINAYKTMGRQAFLPVGILLRILAAVSPDLVVVTNSPRTEQAAAIAARQLGIPVVCLVDLFALDEVKWIGKPDYADHICVLNESVKQFLVNAGRRPDEITATGNPGFDALFNPELPDKAVALRAQRDWQDKRVILWASVIEPEVHPFNGQPGNLSLPADALNALIRWVLDHDDCILCVRPRPGEQIISGVAFPDDDRILFTGQDWVLAPLLYAADLVVTINSTVGLEGRLVGTRVIQVSGSVLDDAFPLATYGLADETVPISGLHGALDRQISRERHPVQMHLPASEGVIAVIADYL